MTQCDSSQGSSEYQHLYYVDVWSEGDYAATHFEEEMGVFNAIQYYKDTKQKVDANIDMEHDDDDVVRFTSKQEKKYEFEVHKLEFSTKKDMDNAIFLYECNMDMIPHDMQEHDTSFIMTEKDYQRHLMNRQ